MKQMVNNLFIMSWQTNFGSFLHYEFILHFTNELIRESSLE